MTVKERLHRLVDTLPDEEAETAARILEALHTPAGPRYTLDNAPEDDEPYSEEERAAVAEALEDVRAGRVRPLADVKAELGL
jgi:hypothetical protein